MRFAIAAVTTLSAATLVACADATRLVAPELAATKASIIEACDPEALAASP
jgi:hypothetical protein